MTPGELQELLSGIDIEDCGTEGQQYFVRPIPNFESHYFGRTRSGNLCLLIKSSDGAMKPPMRLAGIDACFSVECSIATVLAETETEVLSVVTCTAEDIALQAYFVHVCEIILEILGTAPTVKQVSDAVTRLVNLFQKLCQPPSKTVMGLWAELYVIWRSSDLNFAVRAWRSGIDDRFDFSSEDLRVEIKSTGMRTRVHEFSFEQCNPPEDTTAILVSVMVESCGDGTSLRDLVDRISARLSNDADLIMKLQTNVADALGEHLGASLKMQFDEELAADSLSFFDIREVPAIRQFPEGVSGIRFRSNVSLASPLSLQEVRERHELLPAFVVNVT